MGIATSCREYEKKSSRGDLWPNTKCGKIKLQRRSKYHKLWRVMNS